MDGVNEKGFEVSILYLDLKEGEHPVNQTEKGKESVILSVLLRQMLDHCATVEEDISLADDRNVINTFGGDFHLFVSDAEGDSAVLEWRYDTLTVTRTDIVTNFYVGWDDAEDCYYDGELKEAFVTPEDPEGYHFGYGHGYERFKTIMELTKEAEGGMEPEEAMKILEAVSQEYTGELTSLTQYSVVYHNKTGEMDICAYPDYSEVYHFSL